MGQRRPNIAKALFFSWVILLTVDAIFFDQPEQRLNTKLQIELSEESLSDFYLCTSLLKSVSHRYNQHFTFVLDDMLCGKLLVKNHLITVKETQFYFENLTNVGRYILYRNLII